MPPNPRPTALEAAREALRATFISSRTEHGELCHQSVVYHMPTQVIEALASLIKRREREAKIEALRDLLKTATDGWSGDACCISDVEIESRIAELEKEARHA